MEITILHANVVTPDQLLLDQTLEIQDGKIKTIHPSGTNDQKKTDVFNANGMIVTPGLIDIHIHGGMGADAMDASHESLNRMSTFLDRKSVV